MISPISQGSAKPSWCGNSASLNSSSGNLSHRFVVYDNVDARYVKSVRRLI